MKNEALKKHHFWILAGVAPFLTLLAIILMLAQVGDEIDARAGEIEKNLKEAKGTSPKGAHALVNDENDKETYAYEKKVLLQRREDLWKANYLQQKSLFTWPVSKNLQTLEAKYQKFGSDGKEMETPNQEFEDFKNRNIYEGAYDRAAAAIRPTGFAGGDWRKVLRYVSNWGDRYPTSKQVWLALEDLWVQRSLLAPVRDINAEAAKFDLLRPAGPDGKPTDPPPLKRSFRSRIWDLDLEVPTEGPQAGKVILARLRNRTDRLQLLGNENKLRLNVWLSDAPGTQPILYRIESEFVKAGGVVEVRLTAPEKPDPNVTVTTVNQLLHFIPQGTDVTKITKVEQLLDERTVPVRQVLNVGLGVKDSRHAPAALKPPDWWKDDPNAAAATGTAGFTPGASSDSSSGPPMPGPTGFSTGGFPPGVGIPGATGGQAVRGAKVGPPEAVLNANRERYLETTDQVRRMPVAIVLLVDQMFVPDALVAFANSPLRCQITQTHWRRFRGTLASIGAPSESSEPGSEGDAGSFTLPYGGSSMGGPPGGKRGVSSPSLGPTPPGPMPGGDFAPPSGIPGLGMPGLPFGGTGSGVVSEGQITSGLVELTIYAVVTLYGKYEDKDEKDKATAAGEQQGPMNPAAAAGTAQPTTAPAAAPATPTTPAAPTNAAQPTPNATGNATGAATPATPPAPPPNKNM